MSLQPFPDDWQHAVAIVAHPDDLEYGVASAVARWTSDGKRVSYVLATSGEAGIDGVDPALCGPMREEEERRGASIVGVEHVEFLGLADGLVVEGIELRRAIVGAIRRLRPDIVVTMNFELTWGPGGPVNHADHRAVGLGAIDATATRQTGGCSPISAIAGLECAQSGSRRVRHLPTSLMSPTPSIWALRRCVNTGPTSTGSTTTPPTRTSCFEGAHARQARVCAVRTPSRFKGSLPKLEPVCGHSQTAMPSRLVA